MKIQQALEQLSQNRLPVPMEPENYDHIELTFEEHEAAILIAKKEKARLQKMQAWHEKIRATPFHYQPTALDFYNTLLKTKSHQGNPYKIIEANREMIVQLCLYFSNDSRLGTDPKTGVQVRPDLKHNKGILLMGLPGTGKSHLMNFFSKNPKASYTVPTCKIIADKFRNNWNYEGQDTIHYYSNNTKAEVGHPWNQKELGICFHDLGAEPMESQSYGNKLNVLETILFNRYENKTLPMNTTHITTNLDEHQIEKLYGSRMRDRFREMFNVFVCKWESFRS